MCPRYPGDDYGATLIGADRKAQLRAAKPARMGRLSVNERAAGLRQIGVHAPDCLDLPGEFRLAEKSTFAGQSNPPIADAGEDLTLSWLGSRCKRSRAVGCFPRECVQMLNASSSTMPIPTSSTTSATGS